MAMVEEGNLDRIQQKVEQMGVFFERSGFTPMTGRVFAYLLIFISKIYLFSKVH